MIQLWEKLITFIWKNSVLIWNQWQIKKKNSKRSAKREERKLSLKSKQIKKLNSKSWFLNSMLLKLDRICKSKWSTWYVKNNKKIILLLPGYAFIYWLNISNMFPSSLERKKVWEYLISLDISWVVGYRGHLRNVYWKK